MRARLFLLAFVTFGVGCASAQPLRWSADTRELVIKGRGVSVTAPPNWQLVSHAPDRYEFRFPGGALLVAADGDSLSHRRAAQAVREVVKALEGKVAAQTPPRSISLDYDELTAEYELGSGITLIAFHRTFQCAPLKCHFTLVQRETSELPDETERLGTLPRDPKRKTRPTGNGGLVNAMTNAGARVDGPTTLESETQRRAEDLSSVGGLHR